MTPGVQQLPLSKLGNKDQPLSNNCRGLNKLVQFNLLLKCVDYTCTASTFEIHVYNANDILSHTDYIKNTMLTHIELKYTTKLFSISLVLSRK